MKKALPFGSAFFGYLKSIKSEILSSDSNILEVDVNAVADHCY
jgi:hypothetical protein